MNSEKDGFIVLKEYQLIEFFGSEPVEKSVDDGYFCYEVTDDNMNILRFSFNIFEKSIQTALICNDIKTMVTSYEGNVDMKIENETLNCIFVDVCKKTVLTINLKNGFNVNWSTLRLS